MSRTPDITESAVHSEQAARARGTEGLPMFDAPAETKEKHGWAEKYAKRDWTRDIERLVPLARELAEKAGAQGIRVENIRVQAVERGYLTGQERNLHWIGSVPRRAGLVNSGKPLFRNKTIKKTHGNPGATWVLPEFAPTERAG